KAGFLLEAAELVGCAGAVNAAAGDDHGGASFRNEHSRLLYVDIGWSGSVERPIPERKRSWQGRGLARSAQEIGGQKQRRRPATAGRRGREGSIHIVVDALR